MAGPSYVSPPPPIGEPEGNASMGIPDRRRPGRARVWQDRTVTGSTLGRWAKRLAALLAVGAVALLALAANGVAVSAGTTALPRTDAAPGGPTSLHLIVGSMVDRATGGYWLVASDGGVFAFGAPFFGSAGAVPLVAPIVGMAATPDGGGYWLVAADGGVFAFGDAPFFGSMGGRPLNRGIVGMAAIPDGGGYWFTAADGGVFAFGDAPYSGSTGGIVLRSPVVGMQADPAGTGYWLVAGDGGVFAFGAPFEGSASGDLKRAAVGLNAGGGPGYRIVSANGGVSVYGGASFLGSVTVPPMAGEVVAIDPGHDGGNGGDPGFINQPIDGGGFTETCDTAGTQTAGGYTEHAFNFDVATRLDALLTSEGATVVMTRATDNGVGPCVNTRAAIGNDAHADAAISIHADGGPVTGRGFDVIAPAPVVSSISNNTAIVPASAQLAAEVRSASVSY